MRRRRAWGWAAAGAGLVVLLGALVWPGAEPPPVTADRVAAPPKPDDPVAVAPDAGVQALARDGTAGFNEAAFIRDLRERFGPNLHIPHAQIRSIEQLLSYLKAQYPDDWQDRVAAFLAEIFPAQADQLHARYLSLMQYTEWLTQYREDLRRMPTEQRRAALWQARELAFGADAQEIWAAERRSQQLGDALVNLPADGPAPVRAERFAAAVHEIYGERAPQVLKARQTELINRFLATEDVQAELRQMPAGERRDTLRAVRQTLGMDAAAIDRWEQLDQQRDQRWSAGQDYMAQRGQVMERFAGAERQQRLAALRQEFFGPDAALIADEEAAGFYRFSGERRYGRE